VYKEFMEMIMAKPSAVEDSHEEISDSKKEQLICSFRKGICKILASDPSYSLLTPFPQTPQSLPSSMVFTSPSPSPRSIRKKQRNEGRKLRTARSNSPELRRPSELEECNDIEEILK